MTPQCPGCGQGATDCLTLSYRYPRAEYLPEAADPWNVQGSSPVRTCGSVACEAAAVLTAVDEIITRTAVNSGHLLNPPDVQILGVAPPGNHGALGLWP